MGGMNPLMAAMAGSMSQMMAGAMMPGMHPGMMGMAGEHIQLEVCPWLRGG